MYRIVDGVKTPYKVFSAREALALHYYSMGLVEIDEDDIVEVIDENRFLIKRRFK